MHHKKGRSTAATSHESRPVKPSFCIIGPSTEDSSSGGRTDNSQHRAWQALGIIILILARDATQRRGAATPGKKPASAPEASQKPQRAQGRANSKILTLQRMSSRPGDTTAASLTAGNTDTSHISFIHDRPSPPPRWDSTPHAPTPTLQGRGGHCTTGVALERDINQHMDAEGEITREQVRGET